MIKMLKGGGDALDAVRAAVPQGRRGRRLARRQHPRLSRAQARPRAADRGVARLRPRAATHRDRLRRRDPRHPPPDLERTLLRGPEEGGESARDGLPRPPPAEIPRLLRARAGEQPRRRRPSRRRRADVCRSVAVPAGGGLELRIPQRHGEIRDKISAAGAALRDSVKARPRIAAYLASPRRLPFNEDGIFRHYPELDRKAK